MMRTVVAVVVTGMAGLMAVGSGVAFVFERDAFGTGADSARPAFLVLYALLMVGCVAVSVVVWRWALPTRRGWALPVLVVSVAVALVMLGATGL